VLRLPPALIAHLEDRQQYTLTFSATTFLGASAQQDVTFAKVSSREVPSVGIVGGAARKLSIAAGARPSTEQRHPIWRM
jgi:hypothetical protein